MHQIYLFFYLFIIHSIKLNRYEELNPTREGIKIQWDEVNGTFLNWVIKKSLKKLALRFSEIKQIERGTCLYLWQYIKRCTKKIIKLLNFVFLLLEYIIGVYLFYCLFLLYNFRSSNIEENIVKKIKFMSEFNRRARSHKTFPLKVCKYFDIAILCIFMNFMSLNVFFTLLFLKDIKSYILSPEKILINKKIFELLKA